MSAVRPPSATSSGERFDYDEGWYVERLVEPARRQLRSYTAFCSEAASPRGQYDEEIDVRARSASTARRIAEAVLERDYQPGMTVRRLEQRFGWFV